MSDPILGVTVVEDVDDWVIESWFLWRCRWSRCSNSRIIAISEVVIRQMLRTGVLRVHFRMFGVYRNRVRCWLRCSELDVVSNEVLKESFSLEIVV